MNYNDKNMMFKTHKKEMLINDLQNAQEDIMKIMNEVKNANINKNLINVYIEDLIEDIGDLQKTLSKL